MSLIIFRIIFFCLIPIGILILVKTIGLLKGIFSGEILAEIPFTKKEVLFKVAKPGVYAVWQKGLLFQRTLVDKFRLEITTEPAGEKLDLSASLFNPHINGFDTARMEMSRFSADIGTYKLRLVEGSSASIFEKLFCKLFPAKSINYSQYFIQVRESRPIYYMIAAIPLFTISAFCIIGGLVAGFIAPVILNELGVQFS